MNWGWQAWVKRAGTKRAGVKSWIGAACLFMALQSGLAQKAPAPKTLPAGDVQATRTILVDEARALESRGRPDMAVQLWQQILLSDPNNAEALAGLARDLKLQGSFDQANRTLDRLRKVNPNDPNIAKIEALSSTRAESDQLRHAGDLARQGKLDASMAIYKQLYGDHPPDGDIALAYYQTLYGTQNGKEAAIAGMRAMAARNPGDSRFVIALGVMLTYDGRTRAEGIRILQQHPQDTDAQAGLRQALIWDAANPSSADELRAYLKLHPHDAEVASHLRDDEAALARMNSGIARTPEERAAFAALNAHRLDEAEKLFNDILAKDPKNARAQAGMGFLRMQQKNFGGAISYLTLAEQNGYKARTVETALATSRFWYTMGEASEAFDDNQFAVAQAKFKAALVMNPRSPEALNGLAGLYIKQQQYAAAQGIYQQLVRIQPANVDGWRGLFDSYARLDQNKEALAVTTRFPATVKAALAKDPDYLRTLASIYQAENRNADAERVLAEALALPFPDNGTTLLADTKLQYAGILNQAKHYDQAAALYVQILNADPGNVSAWEGLISAHHALTQDSEAIADIQKMPAATYEAALADPGFLTMLAAIYQQANQFEVAQGLLERAEKLQIASGLQPPVDEQVQLASIYLLRNNPTQAYSIFRQVLANNPERADAWQGLISALQATNRNSQALQELQQIPAPVRDELESDVTFIQTEASLYAGAGDIPHAIQYMNIVEAHYAKLKQQPPAAIDIQNAWLLYNTGNDRALYPALMRMGGRTDLTIAQRETVQTIWANWSVRRAGTAIDNGDPQRALDILDAASKAFPNNLSVRKAVAGGYARLGRGREALAIFKTVPMQDASAGDFEGAVSAALAANDRTQAEIWLRQALDRYPRDPGILMLAAQYEQSRGDNERAADYYRASIAVMPQASPVDRLAHVLVYPEQDNRPHKAVTAADLQRLLNPDEEPFPKTTQLPPLPAYGIDPYNGTAPVILNQPITQPQQVPQSRPSQSQPTLNSPASQIGPPSGSDSNPAVISIPSGKLEAPVLNGDPQPVSSGGTGAMLLGLEPVGFQAAAQSGTGQSTAAITGEISANPPHSLASDAYKGLIFSLIAEKKYPEALQEVARVPPDIRAQLEMDIEYVQGIANLYIALGDTARAMSYMDRIEDFYLVHRTNIPAGLAIQHAWLLYNTNNDAALYPVLLRLDQRTDLTPAQLADKQNLWASWAVRRASQALDSGNNILGIEILQAASQDYPDNLNVRRAVAGAYAKVGRAQDALALFKTIPMSNATPGDYQSAINAAMAATDMAQAEAWLRQALQLFPNDPQILGEAARFEQARGNNERASEYWRDALKAMPPGSSIPNLATGLGYPAGSYRTPVPGDTRRLLDPRLNPVPTASQLVPLPSYTPQPTAPAPATTQGTSAAPSSAPSAYAPYAPLPAPAQQQQQPQWTTRPSDNPLPMPSVVVPQASNPPVPNPMSAPVISPNPAPVNPQSTNPGNNQPIYIPQGARINAPAAPVLIEQSATHNLPMGSPSGQSASNNPPQRKSKNAVPSSISRFTGRMNIPPSEENIASVTGSTAGDQPASQQLSFTPPATASSANTPARQLRISSEPMDPAAAQAQALFADQTDSQLTQGSANVIHALPNTTTNPLSTLPGQSNAQPTPQVQYNVAQYTPSAQEAATGAYSAPAQQTASPQTQQPAAKPSPENTTTPTPRRRRRAKKTATTPLPPPETLGNAPATELTVPAEAPPQEYPAEQVPAETQSTQTPNGLSDEELEQRNLPPLRGPWARVQRQAPALSPRDLAERQLESIESGYSSWLGGTGLLNYRSGNLGYDHLSALEAPFEASMHIGYGARLTIVAKPVFLDSGQATGTATISVLEAINPGTAASLTAIPEPIGTYVPTSTSLPPPQQNAVGLGGEVQLAFPHFAVAGGYTPYGFLVSTFTARANWHPGNGPFTFSFFRDSVKDSQLSYGGLRDPAGTTLGSLGQIWGGIVANDFHVQYGRGDAQSGYYFAVGGQYMQGYVVEHNARIDGSGGAYWRVLALPEYGTLSIGANFFAMHYTDNQDAFTHGMGGYFSPQGYFLANIPFTWAAHYGTRWHYQLVGAAGVQAFSENETPLFPLTVDKNTETLQGNPMLPDMTSVGPNYDLRAVAAYELSPHWFVGGFFGANNTRNYNEASVGFYVRYTFREQPSTVTTPTGLFPTDGLRPFTVP